MKPPKARMDELAEKLGILEAGREEVSAASLNDKQNKPINKFLGNTNNVNSENRSSYCSMSRTGERPNAIPTGRSLSSCGKRLRRIWEPSWRNLHQAGKTSCDGAPQGRGAIIPSFRLAGDLALPPGHVHPASLQ